MKTIIFVRHAKSNWDNPNHSDFDRPLNNRGISDAPIMAKKLKALVPSIDLIYSSPANRAFTTAKIFADAYNYNHETIVKEQAIYVHGLQYFNSIVSSINSNYNTVILFGHNPDITSLATFYTNEYFDNVPTCGVICIDFDCNDWEEVRQINGKIRFFDFPKNS